MEQAPLKTVTAHGDFKLTTTWRFDAPVEAVWQILSQPNQWPQWWPAVLAVTELEPGDAQGIGAYRRMHWRTALPYRLSFNMRTTRIVKHRLIEGQSDGNLAGTGCWQLFSYGQQTRVQYEWRVSVTKPWMRAAAPLLRRVFAWNHGIVMEWGRQGFQRRLKKT